MRILKASERRNQ